MSDAPSIPLGLMTSICRQLPYQADPLALYEQVTCPNQPSLLLESATVTTRQHLQSILLIRAALEFECYGPQVTITALTSNGEALLPWLTSELAAMPCQLLEQTDTQLRYEFHTPAPNLDEDSRLRAVSNIEPLRRVLKGIKPCGDNSHPMALLLGGVFAYDYVATFESLPDVATGDNQCPDYIFYLAETTLVIDHQQRTTVLLGSLFGDAEHHPYQSQLQRYLDQLTEQCQTPMAEPTPAVMAPLPAFPAADVTVEPSAKDFAQRVELLQQHIQAGDIFQAVAARSFKLPCDNALAAYRVLKQTNPSPYLFFLRSKTFELFGASPESALKYTAATNQVELYPIAVTRPRGRTANGQLDTELDNRLELELRLDQKETAEHIMLVDLARNDLAKIATPGSRHVANLMTIDRYAHVMHLVSRVTAQLAADLDALDAYRACMNMGTLVGAPKLSAARLLRQLEQQRRGSYGGALGYLNGAGDMDTCIVIRSAFVQHGYAIVQAGAGIVHASQPSAEVAETEHKAKAVILAIQQANTPLKEPAHVTDCA